MSPSVQQLLAIASPFLLALLGGIGWLYRHERERRQAAENQLSDRKRHAYLLLLNIFFDAMRSQKARKWPDKKALADRFMEVNRELILYGSDKVLAVYQTFVATARENQTDLRLFGELIAAIRRDMGHFRTKIDANDVLRQFIVDFDSPEVQDRLRAPGT